MRRSEFECTRKEASPLLADQLEKEEGSEDERKTSRHILPANR